MKITYISASIIPSDSANSVHVMKMCSAITENGHDVILVGTKSKNTYGCVYSYYNVKDDFGIKLSSNNKFSSINRLYYAIKYSLNADIVYTRWIVAAKFLALFTNKKIIYEHHAPFKKGLNKFFEKSIIKSENVIRHVFITNSLKEYYLNHYPHISVKDLVVLPDGADLVNIEVYDTHKDFDCIYVGSFQQGKGVNTVIDIANVLPDVNFAIVGGTESEVLQKKKLSTYNNIKWFGHLPHNETEKVLKKAKIALLPNKPEVLVGKAKQDIGKWTSPMKMFEYMSHKKAIISSDLDVLKEVLNNNDNCLLVSYDNISEWKNTITKLLSDEGLAEKLSNNAYNDLRNNYTWKSRAKKSLKDLRGL